MITATTTTETRHGNPCERLSLPAGLHIQITPASNLPKSSLIKWWAKPLPNCPWPKDITEWSKYIGVGLQKNDVKDISVESNND